MVHCVKIHKEKGLARQGKSILCFGALCWRVGRLQKVFMIIEINNQGKQLINAFMTKKPSMSLLSYARLLLQ